MDEDGANTKEDEEKEEEGRNEKCNKINEIWQETKRIYV
jgi:hypothetical protein